MCACRATEINPLLLHVDELEYELRIRGVPFVRQSSKMLADLLVQHIDHPVKEQHVEKLVFQNELRALKPKVAELEVLMSKSCSMQVDPGQLRVVTLYLHLVSRIRRIMFRAFDGCFDDFLPLAQRISVVSKHLLALWPDLVVPPMHVDQDLMDAPFLGASLTAPLQALSLEDRPQLYPPQNTPSASRWPPNSSAQPSDDGLPNLQGRQTAPQLSGSDREGSTPTARRRRTPMRFCHYNPVSRWMMRYDGGDNLFKFLQQVEDAAEAHDVTHEELLRSLGDLLTGPAKVWFRANRKEITSWESCKEQMDERFLHPDIDSFIMIKIGQLQQKPGETYLAFEARADKLFQSLRKSLHEEERIRILLKGMDPYYKTKMHTSEVHSLRDLRHLCKTVDTARALKWKLRRDEENKEREEPSELQLRATTVNRAQMDPRRRNSTPAIRCWRCGRYGHSSMSCTFRTFCKVCGTRDVVTDKCFNCVSAEERGLWSNLTNNWLPYSQEVQEAKEELAAEWAKENPVPRSQLPATVMNPGATSTPESNLQRQPPEPPEQGHRAPAQARFWSLFSSPGKKPKRP